MILMRTGLIEYFDPLYDTFFPGQILLVLFLIKLLFEIDSFSALKVKKTGHSFRWLIKKKKKMFQSEKFEIQQLSNGWEWDVIPSSMKCSLGTLKLLSELDTTHWADFDTETFSMYCCHALVRPSLSKSTNANYDTYVFTLFTYIWINRINIFWRTVLIENWLDYIWLFFTP